MSTYVFIGHGWNLNSEIVLQDYNCDGVLALERPEFLMEETRDFRKLFKDEKENKKRFLYHLLKPDHKINDFCLYTNKCPEMLLTTFQKIGEDNILLNLDEKREIDFNEQKVFLLSEILSGLSKNETNIKFVVYSCRSNLTNFQKDNLNQFREGEEKIREYINTRKIEVVKDLGFLTKCKPLDDEVLNILSGNYEKDEVIETERHVLKEIKERYENDMNKVYKLLSDIAYSLYEIHKKNKYIVDISRNDIHKVKDKFEIIGNLQETNKDEKFFKNIEELLEDIRHVYKDKIIKEKISSIIQNLKGKHVKKETVFVSSFSKNRPRTNYVYNYPADSTSFIDIVKESF